MRVQDKGEMLREKELTLTSAVKICRATEIMDNKLKAMLLGSCRPGESLNVAEGQRQGWQPTSIPFESASKPAQTLRGTGKCK